ncbi:MAG: FtsX-like permease family protein [Bacillota bacterium]
MLWLDQFKKLRQRPLETFIMSAIVFVITVSFIAIHPMSTRLDDNVDRYLEDQAVEDFHISMGMIDFNHLTGTQRLDVYQTMNLYPQFPALDESDPVEMNQINMVIADRIYQYPELIDRLYDSMIQDILDEGYTVEKRLRLNLVDGAYNYRFISVNEMVNVPYMTEGRVPSEGEIALLEPFKDANDLAVGDTFSIQGQSFIISGFFYAPEFILPALNATNLQYDASRDAIVLAPETTLLSFNVPFRVDYQIIGDFSLMADTFDIYDILAADLHLYGRNMQLVETVVPRDLNYRIEAVGFESEFTEAFVLRFLVVFFVLALCVFMFYIKRVVDRQKTDLITLRKLGYTRRSLVYGMGSIIMYYGVIMSVAAAIGLMIGYGSFDAYSARYAMPFTQYSFPFMSVLIGFVVPLIMLALFILGYTSYHLAGLFKTKTVTKLSMVFATIRHGVLEGFIFLVIASMVLISVLSSQLFAGFKDDTLDGKAFASMIYYYNYQSDTLSEGEESFVHHSVSLTQINDVRLFDETIVQGYGINQDTTLLRLETDGDNGIPLLRDDLVLVSQNAAQLHDIEAGDVLMIKVGYVQSSFTVAAVVDEWMERSIYMTDRAMLTMLGYEDMDLYNGMFSKDIVEDETGVFRHLKYRVMVDQIEMMFYASNALIGTIMVLSIVLAGAMLYFFIYDRLQFASAYLLTLRALGYTIKETYVVFFKRMFLVFVGSFMVAVVVSQVVITSVLDYVYDVFGFTFPFALDIVSVLAVFIVMSLGFLGSTYCVHRRVANQPLSTLLKKV